MNATFCNQMFSIFAPSIVAVFLYGILTKKGSPNAAFWTLILGSLFAASVFVIEKYIPIYGVENIISSTQGLGINWLRQIYLFFIVSTIIYFSVSALDKSTFDVPEEFYINVSKPSTTVRIASIILVVVMVIIYSIFY